jgi:hypothetical protein
VAENIGNKGTAGGYAPLDANALVPFGNLPVMAAINGTSVPTNSASDQTVVTTAPAAGAWTSLPSCPDALGNHLNYSQATHGFLCGNTGSAVGSVGFSGVAGGTNANGLLIGGTLSYTGGGQINANQLGGVTLSSLPSGLLTIATGTGVPGAAASSDVINALGFPPENTANKGAGNGYAPLDSNRLLPVANLPPILAINGTSVPGNNASDQTVVTTAPSLGSWTTLPSCQDTGGNHLNYNVTAHEFSCGNTAGSAGNVLFGGVGSGTNSNALLIGGSLSYTGGGQVNANQLSGVSLPGLSTGLLKITTGSGAPSAAAPADVTGTLGFTPENSANKGTANGYAALDSSAHLTASQMPAFTGDLSNSALSATVTGLQGRTVAGTAPAGNQVLQWNGSQWTPATLGGGTLGNFTIGPAAGGSGNGSNNTAIGFGNLAANTTGYQNIAIGQNALSANTTGSQNVAVGSLAMAANTTGSYNTAVGENALGNNTTGYDNFAFGLRALYQNTTGYNNAAFGIDSVGINTAGYRNSGFGTDSCAWNVTGYENSCMGMNTLWSLTTGYDNAGTGFNAMFGVTSGHYLTGLGAYADMYYPNTMSGMALTATNDTANLSAGWYWYKVSFVLNGQETALSNNSYLGVLTTPGSEEVTITGLPVYSGPFTASARRIYRTVVCPTTLCTVITANQAPRQWYYVATISDNATTTYVDTTADVNLGPQESGTPSKSLAIGAYATVYGSYQMVVGSDPAPIQQIWLGNGMVSALSPSGVLVSSSGASGANAAGQDIILAGGPGTGSANGGNVIFGTVPGAASGSLWNSLVNRWKIDSATGNLMSLSTGGIAGVTGTVDFSGTAHALPARVGAGAGKPSTCTVGEQYFANDAAAGQNLYGCTAANTWTLEAGGGGGGAVSSIFGRTGAVTAAANDYDLSQIATGTLSATGGTIYNPAGSGNTQVVFKNSSSQAANGAGPVLWQNNAGSTMSFINWDGGFAEGDGTNYKISLDTGTLGMSSDSLVAWRSVNNVFSGTPDTGLVRESAGIVKVTNGSSGYGTLDTGGLSINGTALATALTGDVTGAFGANTVGKIQGLAVSGTAPSNGQVLQWNGSQWTPATVGYSQISGTLPDAALPIDAVTAATLNNSTLTASLTSLATTSAITSGGAVTANGNVYANTGSSAAGCLHLSDTNGAHDMGLCAPSSGFSGLLNLWAAAGTAGQVTTTDGANNLLWSNLSGIVGTLTSAQMPTLTGDVTNSGLATVVTALQGRAMAGTAPSGNQVLQWSGSQWAPGTVTLTQIAAGTLTATGGTVYNSASGQNTQIVIQNGPNQATSGTASVLWKNNAGSNIAFINWDGGYSEGDGTNYKVSMDTSTLSLSSDSVLVWHSVDSTFSGTLDTGLLREAAGIVKVTNGASGYGAVDAGGYSASGTAGVTSTTCTQWTNGLCTHN